LNTDEKYAKELVDAAIEVHKTLGGPGLLEGAYQQSLVEELRLRGVPCRTEVQVPVFYKGIQISKPLYIDVLVGDVLIIEVKATEKHHGVHSAQLLTYLRLSNLRLGLLINFGEELVKDGISRVVNQRIPASSC
jgi:GxxExxY protein